MGKYQRGGQKNRRRGTCGTTSKYEGKDVWKYYDKKGRRQGRRGAVMRRRGEWSWAWALRNKYQQD
jgi:hypothetical protein